MLRFLCNIRVYDEADPRNEPHAAEYRRSPARRTSAVPLEVESDHKILVATIVNVGPDSLCVRIRENIRATRVRVRKACEPDAKWHQAEVVHCTDTLGGYKLGLKVERGTRPV